MFHATDHSSRPAAHRVVLRIVILSCVILSCCSGFSESRSLSAQTREGESEYGPSILKDETFSTSLHAIWDQSDGSQLEFESIRPVTMLQQTPFLPQRITDAPAVASPAAAEALTRSLFAPATIDRSIIRRARLRRRSYAVGYVRGAESLSNVTSDVGNLVRKSPGALGVNTQPRNPVVTDARIRGSRTGALPASGSHWVPARMDLDTAVSKLDSRLVQDMIIIPGPYSSQYGPGFGTLDIALVGSPRYLGGRESHGMSSLVYHDNGENFSGLQTLATGAEDWGLRFDYSYRRGRDYQSGGLETIPAGFESQTFKLSAGRDLDANRSIEFDILRLDQSDVEFPGYVFDIDYLVTDAYEIQYFDRAGSWYDQSETEIWYNFTRFEGDAQDPSKRQQFPILNQLQYVGFTDVESLSTGYRQLFTWGTPQRSQWTAGHDLRFIKQELNEISSGIALGGLPTPFANRNSPIPRSFSANPGVFVEYEEPICKHRTARVGGRLDFVQTNIVDDPAKLQQVGLDSPAATYEEVLGTAESQLQFVLWHLNGTLEQQINDCWSSSISLGYSERPPTLTELYAAQPFVLVMQNGLNTVTGDPRLDKEKLLQFDVTVEYETTAMRAGARGFSGWSWDYITFETTSVLPALNTPQQVNYRYVNTSLATLAGFESFVEWFPDSTISPFANVRFVDGRDRTRNGNFATLEGSAGNPSSRDPALFRGEASGVQGADSEPLPGISPLETQIGLRLQDAQSQRWNLELSARVVDNQDRVATSLLEMPTAGFTVWDLRGIFRPKRWDGLTVVAGIENFTDKRYFEHLAFRNIGGSAVFQPGINVYFGTDLAY